jgi:biopolymer transport protein ExbD
MHLHHARSLAADPEVLLDINTTPLIDVMLVLLIMLIITIPVQLHAVNLNLPVAAKPSNAAPAEIVKIDIDEKSVVYWQGAALANTAQLELKMAAAALLAVQPEVHLRPHKAAQYAVVAQVLAATKRLGLTKIAVVGAEQFTD